MIKNFTWTEVKNKCRILFYPSTSILPSNIMLVVNSEFRTNGHQHAAIWLLVCLCRVVDVLFWFSSQLCDKFQVCVWQTNQWCVTIQLYSCWQKFYAKHNTQRRFIFAATYLLRFNKTHIMFTWRIFLLLTCYCEVLGKWYIPETNIYVSILPTDFYDIFTRLI